MTMTNHIEFGLCCINTVLRKQNIFPNRTCRLSTATTKGLKHVQSLSLKNLEDVLVILDWCKRYNITSYRLSSDMFPHISNPQFSNTPDTPSYSLDFAKSHLRKIGEKARTLGIRLSMHPGQFNQIASESEKVFANTKLDLLCHTNILDEIEQDGVDPFKRAIICIHGGGVYGDKKKTMERWCERFKTLPFNVKSRICLENCEKCYSADDCLVLCRKLNIPCIFDTHHYNCYSQLHPDETQRPADEIIPDVLQTWKRRGLKPYFHISEQGTGKIGHHSDYVENIPDYLLDIPQDITIDIEAKAKEQAILRLLCKYRNCGLLQRFFNRPYNAWNLYKMIVDNQNACIVRDLDIEFGKIIKKRKIKFIQLDRYRIYYKDINIAEKIIGYLWGYDDREDELYEKIVQLF